MGNLISPSAPLWMNILLITLTVSFAVFMCGLFVAFITRNEKLGEFSIKAGMISFCSTIGLAIVFVIVSGYMMENTSVYTITKTDTSILVNSKSDWIANSTYNILNHKDRTYYLEDPKHPKNLIKIFDDELDKMMSKD